MTPPPPPQPELPEPTRTDCEVPWRALDLFLGKLGAERFTKEELDSLTEATLPVAVKYRAVLALPELWLAVTVVAVVGPRAGQVAAARREAKRKRGEELERSQVAAAAPDPEA